MKKYFKLYALFFLSLLIVNCENDNVRYNGSPEGRLTFEEVTATISTLETYVLPGQEVEYTATLPASFRSIVNDEVTVEASAFSIGGGVRTSKLVIPVGALSAVGKIVIGGGAEIFDNQIKIKLTAINLSVPVIGKQFTLNSNVLNIDSGSSTIPASNPKRMRVFVSWENKFIPNTMKCTFGRIGSTAVTFKNAVAGTTQVKINNVNYNATFDTDLPTTALNFVNSYSNSPVLNAAGITLTNLGNSVIISYELAPTNPVIIVNGSSQTAFGSSKFDRVDMLGISSENNPRSMEFYVSEIIQKTGKSLQEGQNNCFNPGKYFIKFGPNSVNSLEPGIVDMKYRIAIRFPDSTVKIFTGIYNNISYTLPPINNPDINLKTICTFSKTGLGDNSVYSNFIFN